MRKTGKGKKEIVAKPNTSELLPLADYDKVIVAFSGGKDSLACALQMIEAGVERSKIVLWHHHVDGEPGQENGLMDWPVTENYCRAIAKALDVDLKFSWRQGGFEAEMLKTNDRSKPVSFECEDGQVRTAGGIKGKIDTRRKFPAPTGDMQKRWCSGLLKIEVCNLAINNDPYFADKKVLLVTGERREESDNRAAYAQITRHKCNSKKRRVDQYRAVLEWSEQEVWAIIERNGLRPHPAYRLGWNRVSCMTCVFGDANQWASVKELDPARFEKIARYEEDFGYTIDMKKRTVREMAAAGESFMPQDAELRALALAKNYDEYVKTETWETPRGAYKKDGGPC